METGLINPNCEPFESTSLESPKTEKERKEYSLGLEPTPCDEVGGIKIAYPILPYEALPTGETSEHHTAHRSDRPELSLPNGDIIRTIRTQTAQGPGGGVEVGREPSCAHQEHQRYHYFCSGPEWVPSTDKEQFEYSIWASALYIPHYGLNVRGNNLRVRKMDQSQINRLKTNDIKVATSPVRFGHFLLDHVLKEGLSFVDDNDIEEFAFTHNMDRRGYLGHLILTQTTEVATESFRDEFKNAHDSYKTDPRAGREASEFVYMNILNANPKTHLKDLRRKVLNYTLQTGVDEVELAA